MKRKYGLSILETIYRIRSVRYKGKGRPRKSDYDYKSFLDMQKDIDLLYNRMLNKIIEKTKKDVISGKMRIL